MEDSACREFKSQPIPRGNIITVWHQMVAVKKKQLKKQ